MLSTNFASKRSCPAGTGCVGVNQLRAKLVRYAASNPIPFFFHPKTNCFQYREGTMAFVQMPRTPGKIRALSGPASLLHLGAIPRMPDP